MNGSQRVYLVLVDRYGHNAEAHLDLRGDGSATLATGSQYPRRRHVTEYQDQDQALERLVEWTIHYRERGWRVRHQAVGP